MSSRPDWKAVHKEALQDLRNLVGFDTTNPPGNEKLAAEFLRDRLAEDDIECTLIESGPGRANLVARIEGADEHSGPLMLSGHLDVATAAQEEWTHPPFGAVVEDGVLFGRGALDMKNMLVMSMWCLKLLSRSGRKPSRTVIFSAVADEEAGSRDGATYLVDNHPDLVRSEYVVGEAGGFTQWIGERRFYPIQVAEKGTCRLRLTTRGESGHGSIPREDTAIMRLAEALQAIGSGPLPRHGCWAVDRFIEVVSETLGFPGGLLFRQLTGPGGGLALGMLPPEQARSISPLLSNTVTPTVLAAGRDINVIPSSASVMLDGRTLPGQSEDQLVRELRQVVGRDPEIEVMESRPPVSFDAEGDPLFELMCSVLEKRDPGGIPVPFMMPGSTDAKNWSRLGAKCFGFAPVRLDDPELSMARLVHAADERIPVAGFRWGLEVLWDVVESFVG